ncbi:MAG: hypothetical protein IT293_11900 [Deltaproteobacteria bacterium]|nr:hypothetical protein [Deltaproteobacteria bacterium]
MSAPPRAVELLGPDVVLLAMETLAAGRAASSNAVLVLELDAPIATARVAAALTRFLPVCPWLGGRLHRPFPWGKLRWRVPRGGPTAIPVATANAGTAGLAALVDRELATPIDPRREPPLRVTVAADTTGGVLVLTWAHALMDPHGAEHLVRLLAALDAAPGRVPWSAPPLLTTPRDPRTLRERGALASRGAAALRACALVPPRALASVPTARAPARTRRRHWRFRFAARPDGEDRSRRGMPWRLAVVAAAMTELFRRRGIPVDVPFLVPVSVERRARGEHGPILGNQLAFHFARVPPPESGDPTASARAIRDGLAEAVRRDELEAMAAGMSFARLRPLRGMFRELPWARGGDVCSFHFADTDALLPDVTRAFGAAIVGGYHVAAVPARPGAGVFFTRHGATESLVVSAADEVVTGEDAETIAAVVARAMEWTRR